MTITLLESLFAVIIPVIVSWLKNSQWERSSKVLLAAGISVIFGVISSIVAGAFHTSSIDAFAQTTITIFTLSQTFYAVWFRNTLFNNALTKMQVL
jgi:hypothetical protein